mgnify:FL=1
MTWSVGQLRGQPPCARAGHTANWFRDKIIVFGGGDGNNIFNDIYIIEAESLMCQQLGRSHIQGVAPAARYGPRQHPFLLHLHHHRLVAG